MLCKVSMTCTKIQMQVKKTKSTKMAKTEIANTQLTNCLETVFFVFPEQWAFCLCEVLTRCHRYVRLQMRCPKDINF